jgi:hypothetical protein
MSHELDPKVGRWYRRLDDEKMFKVVSIDEDDGLVEIKTADGEVEELDSSEWIELDLEAAEAPEDYVEHDDDSDSDEDDEQEEELEEEEDEKPKRGRATRSPKDDWDDDEDEDDWDDDDDGDDDYDSDR